MHSDRGDWELSHRELFDLVWSVPLRDLARRFGLSDVGLAKLCARHEIKRPFHGHWARVQHGMPFRRPAYLPPRRRELEKIRIAKEHGEQREFRARLQRDPKVARLLAKDVAADPFVIRNSLRGLHYLVRPGALAPRDKVQHTPRASVAERCMVVPDEQRRRAVLLLDALLTGLEARGFDVDGGDVPSRPKLRVRVLGVAFGLQIYGWHRMVSAPASRESKSTLSAVASSHRAGPLTYAGLELRVTLLPRGRRRVWRDIGTRRLEDRLRSIPRTLIEMAAEAPERP